MKIKILALIIVILLIATSVSVLAVDSDDNPKMGISIKNDTLFFSSATIETMDNYVSLNFEEASSFLMQPGKPMLPVCTKTFTFPFGTKIKNVNCSILDISEIKISGKIKPAPNVVTTIAINISESENHTDEIIEDKSVYSSSDLYPDKWYDYSIRCGLNDDKNVVRVTTNFYPFRYSPLDNLLYKIQGVNVNITYEEPLQPIEPDSTYDMVIIAPHEFSSRLQPLIDHKNTVGVKTILKTTEAIYKEARKGVYGPTGRDRAEKIKLFIYWAKENWDIKYVLLAGGRQGQALLRWHVPVRYSNLDDEPWNNLGWDRTYLSDLYFADIYRYNQTTMKDEFEDWDSNGNNVFAEWTFKINDSGTPKLYKKDVLDLDPDVYVGRLPCRNRFEVTTIVNKIIAYENSKNNSKWFKNMVLVGGDTSLPNWDDDRGIYEGEIITNAAGSYLEPLGFNLTKLWVSNGNFNDPTDVINAINNGSGFVHFSGHGSPLDWGTHPCDGTDENEWLDGLATFDMRLLNNSDKLPIVIVGGCHNSQFDVSLMNFVAGVLRYRLRYFIFDWDRECYGKWKWIPRCWSENFIRQKNGGAIAIIGNTGLGYETPGYGCTEDLTSWMEIRFFEIYANNIDEANLTLGRIHSQAISDFVEEFSPNVKKYETDTEDRKTVEQWVLFGDPSLKIGGYFK